jgi:hypothetical protein
MTNMYRKHLMPPSSQEMEGNLGKGQMERRGNGGHVE